MRPCPLVVLALAAAPAVGDVPGPTRTGYTAALAFGHDTNPLEVSTRGDGPGGTFGQIRLEGEVEHGVAAGITLFADGAARLRLHDEAAANADVGSGAVRGGLAWSPAAAPRFVVAAGGRYEIDRGTYTDRSTGEAYAIAAGSGTAAPAHVRIGDRFDRDSIAAFVNLRFKESERLRLFLDAGLEQTNYVEDYAGIAGLESLDSRSVTLEPGLSVQVHDSTRLIASVARTGLDYERQPALDAGGDPVAGRARSYDYTRYKLTLQVNPGPGWRLWFGGHATGRNDAYAGYLDYRATTSYLALDRDLGPKTKLALQASHGDLAYDNATISGESDGSTLDERERIVLARLERSLREDTRWFAEAGTRHTTSRDPDLVHDGTWLLCGVEFRR
jgi:hypothetical protein